MLAHPLPQLRSLFFATTATTVLGHGAVTHPKPRQAIDGGLAPWSGLVPNPIPFTNPNWCAHPDPSAKHLSNDTRGLSGSNGQACFWCT